MKWNLRKKKSNRKIIAFPIEYYFKVVQLDNSEMRIIITKNDIPYCEFDSKTATFLDPDHIELKTMPIDEKIELWSFINDLGENVDDFTLLCN